MQFMERHRRLEKHVLKSRRSFVNDLNNKKGEDSEDFFLAMMSNYKEIGLIRSHTTRFASYRVETSSNDLLGGIKTGLINLN